MLSQNDGVALGLQADDAGGRFKAYQNASVALARLARGDTVVLAKNDSNGSKTTV